MTFLDRIREQFETGEASLTVDRDGQLIDSSLAIAAVALLLETAASDADVTPGERATILDGIQREFGMNQEKARELLAAAEEERKKQPDLREFINSICEQYDRGQREVVLSLVKAVVRADGELMMEEGALYDYVRSRLEFAADRAR